MPLLSSKRQITLPKELCDRLGIVPGDDLLLLEHKGNITILKRTKGGSMGILKGVRGDPSVSDRESLESTLQGRRLRSAPKRRLA